MKFEDETIDGMMVKMMQYKGETDLAFAVDETVTLKVTVKVTNVSHEINQRNGKLYRTHVLHVQEVEPT